ncbi:polynucleotide adenylyltransferase PcnB [Catenovulum agarivorans]|uniref:polynucleotide adenylyltransferase PcnB n=1 Tax=Catenovulum agarivorans TaxID=1172192 RepID=UPI0004B25B88|nr:polynucleotide adenylyltransferase PcnB [Catenovulum agarivorans]
MSGQKSSVKATAELQIIPRAQHNISRKDISKNALKVLYRLKDAGYDAYLVGGGVRDLLLGLKPKDFDIVTNATPEQIKKCFSNCRLIGRRFRLAHIVFGREIIEVATFRGHHETDNSKHKSDDGQLLRDNVYGDIDQDAERRDFSANSLYYDIKDFSIRDYWGGVAAIANREIELIGDPDTRYREDPVRMLRAVRFAQKLDMQITPRSAKPIYQLAPLLQNIPKARLFEECLKLFLAGKGLDTFKSLIEFGLFQQIFPNLAESVASENAAYQLMSIALRNTDTRINNEMRVTPAFLFAAFLWHEMEQAREHYQAQGMPAQDALHTAASAVLDGGQYNVTIPKRFSTTIRDIWALQPRLEKRAGKRCLKLLEHPKFRAAYDFLLLRTEIAQGEQATELTAICTWWTELQKSDAGKQASLVNQLNSQADKRRPRKRRNNGKRPYNKRRRSNNSEQSNND